MLVLLLGCGTVCTVICASAILFLLRPPVQAEANQPLPCTLFYGAHQLLRAFAYSFIYCASALPVYKSYLCGFESLHELSF